MENEDRRKFFSTTKQRLAECTQQIQNYQPTNWLKDAEYVVGLKTGAWSVLSKKTTVIVCEPVRQEMTESVAKRVSTNLD